MKIVWLWTPKPAEAGIKQWILYQGVLGPPEQEGRARLVVCLHLLWVNTWPPNGLQPAAVTTSGFMSLLEDAEWPSSESDDKPVQFI